MFKETGKDAHVLAIFYLPVLNRKQAIATVRSQTLKMAETCILDLLFIHIYIYINQPLQEKKAYYNVITHSKELLEC